MPSVARGPTGIGGATITVMTDVPTLDAPRPSPGPLGRLAGVAFRRRGTVLLGWLLGFGLAIGLSAAFGGDLATGTTSRDSDSESAQTLMQERFPARSGERVDVVVRADDVAAAEAQAAVTALLSRLAGMPHVAEVEDPYTTDGAIAPDGRTLAAPLYLDVVNPRDMPIEDTERLLAVAEDAEADGVDVALGGRTIQLAEQPGTGRTELLGLMAAAVILLIVFGSVVAAGLPLGMAIGGLAVSSGLVGLWAAMVDVPDFAQILAAMLGIAVGIDYALLMVTRFREWRAAGLEPEAATVATPTRQAARFRGRRDGADQHVRPFAMGLSIMNGTAVVTMGAVLIVMLAATTLFPAMLGYLGRRIDRLGLPGRWRRDVRVTPDGHLVPAVGWVRWSRSATVQRLGRGRERRRARPDGHAVPRSNLRSP